MFLCFCSVLCLLCFVRVCLYVLRGHLLGKGWPLGSHLWCLLWVCHFPIGILGQVWYLIVSIPDLCNLTYFLDTRLEVKFKVTATKGWYATLRHPKMHIHIQFGIPTSNSIKYILGNRLFQKLGQRSRSQWPKFCTWHFAIPRCIHILN